MSIADKARNKMQQLEGKLKAATGRATDNPDMEARGKTNQRASHLKDAGEKLKDAFRPRRHRQM
jgi:uncharacterized protein YjbJ (UPF0337 family)